MVNDGCLLEEILKCVDEVRKNICLYVVVDILENLVKGGCIGKGKVFIGFLFNIKLIVSFEDGVYNFVMKVCS